MYTVLYVDDEPGLLELAKLFLEETGEFSIETLTAASAAIVRLERQKYDAIISDYQMPVMDGIAFLTAVRGSGNTTPFILFTGRGREEIVIQAINNGADFYLQKGGEPTAQFAELAHKIRQAVTRRKAQDDLRAAYEQIAAAEEELRSQYDELAASERRIRENEKMFRELFDMVPLSCTVTDKDGRYILVNRNFEDTSGFSSSEVIGKTSAGLGLNSRETDQTLLEILKNTGRIETTEATAKSRDGTERTVLVSSRSVTINAAPHVITAVFDITDRKRAEDALKRSEERYRSVVNDQTMMIARFTPDGRITFVNDAYHTYFAPRLGLENVIGRTIREIMQVPDYDAVETFLASLTEDRPVRDMEREITGSDGNRYWQVWTVKALFDQGRRVAEYQVIGRDITEQKRAEEVLKESEGRFRAIIDQSPFAIIVFTPDGSVVHANEAHCRFWGIPMDRVLAYNVFRDPQMERLGLIPAFRRAFAGELLTVPPLEYDAGTSLGTGRKRLVRGDFYPIRDQNGAVTHVIIVHQDVSGRPA